MTQHGKDATWTEPNGSVSLLNDRPPLALDAVVHYADGRRFPVTAIAVHQRSLNDVDSVEVSGPTTLGDRVRRKRQEQAEYLAGVIQQMQLDAPSRRIVTLGDFNAFAFNDGLADTMNVVTGTPTADEQTAVPGDGIDLVDPDLVNLGVLEPQEERYSFVFGGNAQTLDHVLANEELVLASSAFGLDHARINADFPESARNDAGSPSRLSDHDPVVAYFEARHRADLAVSASAVAPSVSAGESIGFHASVSNLGPDAAIDTGVGFALDAELPGMAVVAPAGWDCDAAQVVDGATSIACHRDSLANGDSASFQLSAMTGAAQAGRTVTLAVAATSLSLDPASANDEATASVDVRALPTADLALQFSGPASVPASAFSVVYSATLRNLGTAAAAQPVLVFDGNTMNATASLSAPAGWQCAKQGSNRETTFRCAAASLPAGTSAVFTLKVNAKPTPSDRTIRIGGTAGTVSPESDVSNNRAEHATRVQ
ncbi:MAG: hypothetical protein EOP92_36575 [Lysobacteraceae bacterium]|nr:MAG: hypothetical protein EOP92_36575 [Xanthomonadaceae bacterium]